MLLTSVLQIPKITTKAITDYLCLSIIFQCDIMSRQIYLICYMMFKLDMRTSQRKSLQAVVIICKNKDKMNQFQKLKKNVMRRSRTKKLDHFYSLCDKQSSVLDVGVSNNEHNDSVNLFLRNFRFNSCQYTGLATQPMDNIRKKYPKKKFVEYPGGIFPFSENEFDWVFSNAVIEHVGNRNDQILFVNEMLRIGKNIFFTTPNKWFPIESHTDVFFRHWFDNSFYDWCKLNAPYWSIDNLLLLGKGSLIKIMELSNADKYKVISNRMLGLPMTFTVVCSKEIV